MSRVHEESGLRKVQLYRRSVRMVRKGKRERSGIRSPDNAPRSIARIHDSSAQNVRDRQDDEGIPMNAGVLLISPRDVDIQRTDEREIGMGADAALQEVGAIFRTDETMLLRRTYLAYEELKRECV